MLAENIYSSVDSVTWNSLPHLRPIISLSNSEFCSQRLRARVRACCSRKLYFLRNPGTTTIGRKVLIKELCPLTYSFGVSSFEGQKMAFTIIWLLGSKEGMAWFGKMNPYSPPPVDSVPWDSARYLRRISSFIHEFRKLTYTLSLFDTFPLV